MEVWSHDGKLYEVNSRYSLPDDAWQYDLMGLTGPPGTGPYLCVSVPDATPMGPFTPMPAEHIIVRVGGGTLPWPILDKLIIVLNSSGDLIDEVHDLSTEATALPLTLNAWTFGARRFEVTHFHDDDAWRYELCEAGTATENNYIDVRIPDASPSNGPFLPVPRDRVTLTIHGEWTLPWPVFRRFLDAIRAAGDIVESVTGNDAPAERS